MNICYRSSEASPCFEFCSQLLTSGDQTLQGALTFETGPTFSDITTTGLIDGEDVVELYLRIHNTPSLNDFEDFVDGQCDLLDDMHDAFEGMLQ